MKLGCMQVSKGGRSLLLLDSCAALAFSMYWDNPLVVMLVEVGVFRFLSWRQYHALDASIMCGWTLNAERLRRTYNYQISISQLVCQWWKKASNVDDSEVCRVTFLTHQRFETVPIASCTVYKHLTTSKLIKAGERWVLLDHDLDRTNLSLNDQKMGCWLQLHWFLWEPLAAANLQGGMTNNMPGRSGRTRQFCAGVMHNTITWCQYATTAGSRSNL